MTTVITIIIAAVGSTGLYTLIQFLIQRYDTKHSLGKKLDALSLEVREGKAIEARARILSFYSEYVERPERLHTLEQWRQVMEDCDRYEAFYDEYPNIQNGIAHIDCKALREAYAELRKKDKL